MPTRSAMTQAQFNDWLKGYQATRHSLSDSILVLKQSRSHVPPDDQDTINFQPESGVIRDWKGSPGGLLLRSGRCFW